MGRLRAAAVAAGLAGLPGVLTRAEHVLDVSFGMDRLLFQHSLVVPGFQPSRMAADTALCLTLTGFALLLMSGTVRLPHRPIGVNSYIVKPVDFDNFMHSVFELGMYWMLLNRPPV